jgi:glycolate oxidase iron-sulfur subunit
MHIGEDSQALALARQNLRAFPADVDAIITNAAGCGSGMHEYGLLFRGQPEEVQADAFARKVKDISQFLDELGLRRPTGAQPPRKIAYHDACHLAHAQGITSAPRRLLMSIPNLVLLELKDGGLCCGSAGTYNLEQPEIARQLGEMKAQRILDTGAEAVVSGNIGCLTQIKTHLAEQGRSLPIYHTIQVLAQAYRAG